VWGFLCDKAEKGGRKNLLLVGAALWSISSLIIYFTPSYLIFLVARVVAGIGIVAMFPVSFSFITDSFLPGERGKALAAIPIALGLGGGAGIILASIFGETVWRPPFLVMGITGLLFVFISLIVIREPERAGSEPELREKILAGKVYAHRINLKKLKKILGTKTNLWLFLAAIPGAIPLGILYYKFIPYLEIYGLGPEIKTIVTLFIGSGSVFGYLLGGHLGDWANRIIRTGRILVCLLSLFMAVVVLSIAWSIPQAEVLRSLNASLFFLLTFFGAVLAFINVPNLYAILGEVNEPETRGISFSIFNSLVYLATALGVLLGGIGAEATFDFYRRALLWGTRAWLLAVILWLPMFLTIKRDKDWLREIMAKRAKEMI
jgi:predicted MFS family arabinose efflux permease